MDRFVAVLAVILLAPACDVRIGDDAALNHGAGASFTFGTGEHFDSAAFRASVERLDRWRRELLEQGFDERGVSSRTVHMQSGVGEGREIVLEGRLDPLGPVRITLSWLEHPDTTSYTRVHLRTRLDDDADRAAFERLRDEADAILTGRAAERLRLRQRPRS